MKMRFLVLAILGVFAIGQESAQAAIGDQCSTIQTVGGGNIYKNSAPVRANSNLTAPIIGFRREPTLIMTRNISTRGTVTIFDSRGTSIGRCPWATAHGTAGGRYRCTMQTSSLRRTAVRNTSSPTVYFKVNTRSKLCIRIPDAGKCYGSVKGLCNQTLR